MNKILSYTEFRKGYTFDTATIHRENIEYLDYLGSRYEYERTNEEMQWVAGAWEDLKGGLGNFWQEFKSAITDKEIDSLSEEDVLHTVLDLGGIFGDLFFPGVGGYIDLFHAGIYFIQSATVDDVDKSKDYFWYGALTAMFAVPFLNPLQGTFAILKKKIVKLGDLVGKPKPDPKIIEEYLSKNTTLKNFVKQVTEKFDKVEEELRQQIESGGSKSWMKKFEDYLKRGVDKIPWLKKVLENIQGFFMMMKDAILWPFRKLRQIIMGGTSIVRRGVRLTYRSLGWVSRNTLGRIFKSFMKILPGFPKTKKISLFDNLFEEFNKAQQKKGIIKATRESSEKLFAKEVQMAEGDFIIKDLRRGESSATVVVGGRGGRTNIPGGNDGLKEFWEKKWDDEIGARVGANDPVKQAEFLGYKPEIRQSQLVDLSGQPFSTPNISPEDFMKKKKDEWVSNQVRSSYIRTIDKSDFVQDFYKHYEDKIRTGLWYKTPAALYKFLMPVDRSGTNAQTDQDLPGASGEMTVDEAKKIETYTDEQIQELLTDIHNQGSGLGGNNLPEDNEEIEDIADEVNNYPADKDDTQKHELSINDVVFGILGELYSTVVIPEEKDMLYSDFSGSLQEFQRDNGLEDSGNLNRKTVESLLQKTNNLEYKRYLNSYLSTLPQEEEEEVPQSEVEEKDKKKLERKEKRERRRENIKSFGKFLLGEEN